MYVKAEVRIRDTNRLVDEVWVDPADPPLLREVLYVSLTDCDMVPCVVSAVRTIETHTKTGTVERLTLYVDSAWYNPNWPRVKLLVVLLVALLFGGCVDVRKQEAFGLSYGVGTPYHTLGGCEGSP